MAYADFIPKNHLLNGQPYPDNNLDYPNEEPKYYTEDINEVLNSTSAKLTTKINIKFRGEVLKVAIGMKSNGDSINRGYIALPCPPYYQDQKNEGIAGKYLEDKAPEQLQSS